MAYVDLNPIRAAMAETPETSDFTSIKERIEQPDCALRSFSASADDALGIPFAFEDYLYLVDWAGRVICSGKKGFIAVDAPPILTRIGLNPDAVLDYIRRKPERWYSALGPADRLRLLAQSIGQRFIKGIGLGTRLFPAAG